MSVSTKLASMCLCLSLSLYTASIRGAFGNVCCAWNAAQPKKQGNLHKPCPPYRGKKSSVFIVHPSAACDFVVHTHGPCGDFAQHMSPNLPTTQPWHPHRTCSSLAQTMHVIWHIVLTLHVAGVWCLAMHSRKGGGLSPSCSSYYHRQNA
jgi:hypothetical protein